jgi:arsenite methyltransferase
VLPETATLFVLSQRQLTDYDLPFLKTWITRGLYMPTSHQEAAAHGSSTGHVLAASDWLDTHFLAMQPEYEEMLSWVGIQPGWNVLDAACGGGSFLPLMLELVGAGGKVSAIDLAPENAKTVQAKAAQDRWSNLATVDVGSILALPYVDRSFDAVWCANTMQYLSEVEVGRAIRELCRVVRPGGLVALKDYDPTGQLFLPLPYGAGLRRYEAMARGGSQNDQGLLRIVYLSQYMRAAGLVEVRQRPTVMVRSPPLRDVERKFFSDLFKLFAAQAAQTDLPLEEKEAWRSAGNLDAPDHILNNSDFLYRAIQTVFVGRVP